MRRLPRYAPTEEALPEARPAERIEVPSHLFGVVLAVPEMDEAPVLEVLRASLPDFSVESTPATPAAPSVAAVAARLASTPRCVTVGALGVWCFRPRIALLLTGGAAPTRWSAAARALRPEFDLELSEPRPGVLAELAARLSIIACPGDG